VRMRYLHQPDAIEASAPDLNREAPAVNAVLVCDSMLCFLHYFSMRKCYLSIRSRLLPINPVA